MNYKILGILVILFVVVQSQNTSSLRVIDNAQLRKLQKYPRKIARNFRFKADSLQPEKQKHRHLQETHHCRAIRWLFSDADSK